MFRIIALAAMLVTAPFTTAHAAQVAFAPQVVHTEQIAIGQMAFVKLPGNPNAGYKWRLNADQSKGLDFVAVKMVGWLLAQKGQSMFFQPESQMNVSISGKAAGEAHLAFDYYRRVGGRIVSKTSIVHVIVRP